MRQEPGLLTKVCLPRSTITLRLWCHFAEQRSLNQHAEGGCPRLEHMFEACACAWELCLSNSRI